MGALYYNRKIYLPESIWVKLPQIGYIIVIYIAVRLNDNKIVGIIDLRHHINNPVLGTWGGHIGYCVRPCERCKGYAKEMLRQNLINCKKLGIDKVLMTCRSDNRGSEKTILANGGVFESAIDVDSKTVKRYWIKIGD